NRVVHGPGAAGPPRACAGDRPPRPSTAVAPAGPRRHDRGAARLQPRNGDAERRAGHVVEPDLVAEVHRVGVAAVLAADAQLDPRPRLPALLGGDADEPPHAVPVEGLERRHPEDPELQVAAEERSLDVVAGEAPGG